MSRVGVFYISETVYTAQCECGSFGDWRLGPREGGRTKAMEQARKDGWKLIRGQWKCQRCAKGKKS